MIQIIGNRRPVVYAGSMACQNVSTCRSCYQCHAQGQGIIREACPSVVAAFDQSRVTRMCHRGKILFRQGERSRGMYCVDSGRIKLYRTSADGDVQIVRLAGPGDVLGHRSLLTGSPMAATAEVLSEAVVCFVDGDTVLRALNADTKVCFNMMVHLAEALGVAESRLLGLGRMSA
ncbi:MAG: Crp/Fnr family transcriptional regulator, partial [Candidatus Eremiobacterota bacterium]